MLNTSELLKRVPSIERHTVCNSKDAHYSNTKNQPLPSVSNAWEDVPPVLPGGYGSICSMPCTFS